MIAVETEALTKRYGDVTALDGLSLSVEDGELFGLLGPNGSGKTTTIEILTGQIEPTDGTARVLGHDPVADPIAVRREVGVLPEREDPPSFLTPREYLQFVGDLRDLADVETRIAEWAAKLEFEGILDTLAADLSEGERQRVMLSQAFIHEPDLVFIDEPLVNLDPLMQEEVKGYLAGYCEAGNTLFLSTHFMEVAEELCTSVGIIADGSLRRVRDLAAEAGPESEAGTEAEAGAETEGGDGDEPDGDKERERLLDTFVAEVE
ncbi:MAG: ABC transporter ATP-binding protein [Haloarculaceae archaeon]